MSAWFRWLAVCGIACAACGKSADRARPARDAGPRADARPAPRIDAGPSVAGGPIKIPAPTGKYDGADCSASYAPRPDRDGGEMCVAPGGTFKMGAPTGKEISKIDGPRHDVTLSPFFVDRYEVTLAQFATFLASPEGHAIGCAVTYPAICVVKGGWGELPYDFDRPDPGTAPGETELRVRPGEEKLPARQMSQRGAQAYCEWVGKTLPTEAQWEYAAAHDPVHHKDQAFPWGDRLLPKRSACTEELCADGFEGPAPVGSFPRGRSAIGIDDAHGNVLEWVASCARGPYADCGDCRDPAPELGCDFAAGASNIKRGGNSYRKRDEDQRLARPVPVWYRQTIIQGDGDRVTGFRCVTSASSP
jgi:formylglycine-generating enzyme required for sulfatase activity